MTQQFNVGDKVRHTLDDDLGVVTGINAPEGHVWVEFEQDGRECQNTGFLALVESAGESYTFDPGGTPIEYSDVKVGDTIAALTYGQWRIAVAETVTDWGLCDSEYLSTIAYRDSDTTDIRLLHRPEAQVDPVQVAALEAALAQYVTDTNTLAVALVKAGVTVA